MVTCQAVCTTKLTARPPAVTKYVWAAMALNLHELRPAVPMPRRRAVQPGHHEAGPAEDRRPPEQRLRPAVERGPHPRPAAGRYRSVRFAAGSRRQVDASGPAPVSRSYRRRWPAHTRPRNRQSVRLTSRCRLDLRPVAASRPACTASGTNPRGCTGSRPNVASQDCTNASAAASRAAVMTASRRLPCAGVQSMPYLSYPYTTVVTSPHAGPQTRLVPALIAHAYVVFLTPQNDFYARARAKRTTHKRSPEDHLASRNARHYPKNTPPMISPTYVTLLHGVTSRYVCKCNRIPQSFRKPASRFSQVTRENEKLFLPLPIGPKSAVSLRVVQSRKKRGVTDVTV